MLPPVIPLQLSLQPHPVLVRILVLAHWQATLQTHTISSPIYRVLEPRSGTDLPPLPLKVLLLHRVLMVGPWHYAPFML